MKIEVLYLYSSEYVWFLIIPEMIYIYFHPRPTAPKRRKLCLYVWYWRNLNNHYIPKGGGVLPIPPLLCTPLHRIYIICTLCSFWWTKVNQNQDIRVAREIFLLGPVFLLCPGDLCRALLQPPDQGPELPRTHRVNYSLLPVIISITVILIIIGLLCT